MTIQTSTYYRSFPTDGRLVKLAVCFSWILGAFQLACITRSLYWWMVTNSNNPVALGQVPWEFTVYQINAVCASVTVQTFFSHRVYYLSGNLYIGVLVQVLVLLQFGLGAAACVVVNMNLHSPELLKRCTWLIVTWLTSQAIADVVIAALFSRVSFLCWLPKMRTRLNARLATPSPLGLISYSIKKRLRQTAGDHRNAGLDRHIARGSRLQRWYPTMRK
ncbi:hypothetical protein BS47DRAFT_1202719 [Hydnum rufescens UP504]|uniref:Uncharacterized protein n=1 Tax=Hydnum rufescens UP504 TaxID=1448309 RepID=A0A9P6ASH8_9AGAM|nr:hypothetical protein BS47DRAFT_1202719 [Hydnum rufescens UP504]